MSNLQNIIEKNDELSNAIKSIVSENVKNIICLTESLDDGAVLPINTDLSTVNCCGDEFTPCCVMKGGIVCGKIYDITEKEYTQVLDEPMWFKKKFTSFDVESQLIIIDMVIDKLSSK